MVYDLSFVGQNRAFFEELKKMGEKLGPTASEARPRIPHRLQPYWQAFIYLHKRRQWHEGGPQPISMEAISSYMRLAFRVGREQTRRFLRFVDELDAAFLKHAAEEQKRKLNK